MSYPWIESANKIFRIVILVQWLISLLIAFLTSSWLEPFLLGLPILAVPLFLSFTQADKPITRYAYAISVQLFAALHIQQAYGMTELHFEVFVMLAFLVYFRDWKVIAVGTGVVAVHHILFFIVQSSGGALVIFEENRLAFYILVIHALFAVSEGVLLGIMAKVNYQEAKGSAILNQTVSNIMREKDSLDLTIEMPETTENIEEFKTLILAFKALIAEVNTLSKDVSSVAHKVNGSSTTLDESVTHSAQQIQLIVESVDGLKHSISEVANRSQESNTHAENAKNSTLETKQSISGSSETVSKLRETLTIASTAIGELSTKCNNISEVMQSIKSVAEQTNLLALNAAIESARAGEHGRGFAVVADEVRNLAIKSKDSAEEIEQITLGLISSANNSVSQMNDCVTMVDEAATSSDTAMNQMDSVVESFQLVSNNITTVAASAEQQAKNVQSISESAQALNDYSKEEQLNANAMKNEAVDLANLCHKLEQQLKQFSV